jgi:hypothetical protein
VARSNHHHIVMFGKLQHLFLSIFYKRGPVRGR